MVKTSSSRYPDIGYGATGIKVTEKTDVGPAATVAAGSLVTEVLATALLQLGYAVLPPREPDLVLPVLIEAGLIEHEQALYADDELESWQPCLLRLRIS